MKAKAWAAPLAAILSALASVACCLPVAFLAALGSASAGAYIAPLRPWLLGLAGVLLAVGFFQLYGGARHCARRSTTGVALFWIALAAVLALVLFPQVVAGILADVFTGVQ
jgi:hypothetical protein